VTGPALAGRKKVLGAVLALIAFPVVLAMAEAVSYYSLNQNNGGIVSSGERREYLLYVPGSYDRTKPTPLVISLHGAGMWPASQREVSQWNRVADRHGVVVVYPSGIRGGGGARIWRSGSASRSEPGLMKDVRFISELIDTLEASFNIDPARIYANGLSNGGGMSFVLSCTLSDRIAAVGMVGAAHLLPWNWCTDHRAVPMISFHGTADSAAPFHGGASWVAPGMLFPDIRTWTANWAGRNGCAANPTESMVAADVSRREYAHCASDASVVLYTILGGGHTWPGGGPFPEWFVGTTTHNIDASELMWEFFRDHPLRPTQPN